MRYVAKRTIPLFLSLLTCMLMGSAHAKQVKISGEYCYQYGDSESLMVAKEISYAMALRKAIESYKTFIASTSIVKDFKLKRDIVEAIASGYVDNVQIVKQEVQGKTVCTSLIGYVNPNAVKSIISRKVERVKGQRKVESEGLISGRYIKILNYKRVGNEVSILYQAIQQIPLTYGNEIMVDCFDKDGNPMEGTKNVVETWLNAGEVRRINIPLPYGTASFDLRPQ